MFDFWKVGLTRNDEDQLLKRYHPVYGHFEFNFKLVKFFDDETIDRAHWDKEQFFFSLFECNRAWIGEREIFWSVDDHGRDFEKLYIATLSTLASLSKQDSARFLQSLIDEGIKNWIERRLAELRITPNPVPAALAAKGVTIDEWVALQREEKKKKMIRFRQTVRIGVAESDDHKKRVKRKKDMSKWLASDSEEEEEAGSSETDSSEVSSQDDGSSEMAGNEARREALENARREALEKARNEAKRKVEQEQEDLGQAYEMADNEVVDFAMSDSTPSESASDGTSNGCLEQANSGSDNDLVSQFLSCYSMIQERFWKAFDFDFQNNRNCLSELRFSSVDEGEIVGLVAMLAPGQIPGSPPEFRFDKVKDKTGREEFGTTWVKIIRYEPTAREGTRSHYSHRVQTILCDGSAGETRLRNLSRWVLLKGSEKDREGATLFLSDEVFDGYIRGVEDCVNVHKERLIEAAMARAEAEELKAFEALQQKRREQKREKKNAQVASNRKGGGGGGGGPRNRRPFGGRGAGGVSGAAGATVCEIDGGSIRHHKDGNVLMNQDVDRLVRIVAGNVESLYSTYAVSDILTVTFNRATYKVTIFHVRFMYCITIEYLWL